MLLKGMAAKSTGNANNLPQKVWGFGEKCGGWGLNPPQRGEITRKIPFFSF